MNSEIILFENGDLNASVRTAVIDNEPWFVGKDVCAVLGYSNESDAMKRHCKGVAKRYPVSTTGGVQEVRVINEPDMMRLICGSKLKSAQKFEAWVFEKVLPSIRKHGMYATEELLDNPDFAIKVFEALREERQKRISAESKVEELEQKISEGFLLPIVKKDFISVKDLAEMLRQNGIIFGQNSLYRWLKKNKYLRKVKQCYKPTSCSNKLNLFEYEIVECFIPCLKRNIARSRLRISLAGQKYFLEKFLSGDY